MIITTSYSIRNVLYVFASVVCFDYLLFPSVIHYTNAYIDSKTLFNTMQNVTFCAHVRHTTIEWARDQRHNTYTNRNTCEPKRCQRVASAQFILFTANIHICAEIPNSISTKFMSIVSWQHPSHDKPLPNISTPFSRRMLRDCNKASQRQRWHWNSISIPQSQTQTSQQQKIIHIFPFRFSCSCHKMSQGNCIHRFTDAPKII